jgi:SulP family sulfate permease
MTQPGRERRSSLSLPSRGDLLHDLVAGLTVGASQIGNAMAYTLLAGVPPVHGLYAVAAGTPAGALTAGSQRMPIVPTAALCLAAGGAVATLPPDQRVTGLFTLAVLTGALMLVLGVLRAGALVRFVSNAVMIGLMGGIGVQILLSQLGALTGFSSRHDNRVLVAADLFVHPAASDMATTVVGLTTVLLVVVLRRTRLKLFAMALALLVMTVVVAVLDLSSVAVVGDIAPIPRALPWPRPPDFSLVPQLALPAVSLVIIGLVQAAGISRTVPNADGSFGDTSRDFVGHGAANIVSGLLTGAVAGGSVQATALNVGAGARTRWSSVVTGAFVVLVILAAAPLVQQVPLAVTAGILIVAAVSALQPRAARDVWRADRMSAAIMVGTFALVLVAPLQYAVLAGAAVSVLKHIYLSSLDVHVRQIVLDGDGLPREIDAPASLSAQDVIVLDIYGSLFYAAAPKIRASLPAVGAAHCPVVVLRLRGRGKLHSATIAVLREYAAGCAANGGRMYLAGVGQEMEEQLRRTGVLDLLGPDAVVTATDELYGACATAQERGKLWLASQADEAVRGPRAV